MYKNNSALTFHLDRGIPHKDSIRAAKHVLETRPVKEPHTWVLLRLLHFILTKQPSILKTNCMSKYPEKPWERNVLQVTPFCL